MVKDFRYIIKRIIIGVGIALALMFIKGNILIGVQAQEMSSTNVGGQGVQVTSNTSASDFTISGNPWANWRLGHLYFNFGITKVSGSSTDPLIVPRAVLAKSDTSAYICSFGTATYSNSTFTGASYSVDCPMDMGWPGLTGISIIYMPFSTTSSSTYNVQVNGWMTFEQNANTQVNVDTSSTNNAINQQTQNDNTNTQNIINNQNNNTQSIINNQNQNTQEQIESQKVCQFYSKSSIKVNDMYLGANGAEVSSSTGYGITDYIKIDSSSTISVISQTVGTAPSTCFYNVNKSVISCITNNNLSNGYEFTIPNNASYVRFSINDPQNIPRFKVCRNGSQAIADSQQEINNTLNDSTGVPDSDISDLFADFESSDTPITDLLTMPLTLIQAYISGMSGTCQSISLGRLYGNNLVIPCIDIESIIGSNLWTIIDVLCAMFMIYNLSQLFITAFDSLTSLKDNFSWLYGVEGRHVGVPSRVERNSDLY